MKFAIAILSVFFVVLVVGIEAGNAPHQFGERGNAPHQFEQSEYEPAVMVHGERHRRVTCDLLGVNTPWGSFNHALCAAHCLSMGKGFRGGYCDDKGICNCRR